MYRKPIYRASSRPAGTLLCYFIAFTVIFGQLVNASADDYRDQLEQISGAVTLADALKIADQHSPDINSAKAAVESSTADTRKAAAALMPGVSANTYASTGSESSIVTSSPSVAPGSIFLVPREPNIDQDITAMIPLSTGGTLQKRKAAAAAIETAAGSDLTTARLAVKARTTDAYVNVLLQQAMLASAKSKVATETEQIRITQTMVDVGRLAPVDLLREQAELADAKNSSTQSQIAADVAIVDLKSMMGISQLSNISISDNLDTVSSSFKAVNPENLDDALAAAEAISPEVAAAVQRVMAARSTSSASHREYSPQIYAVGMADAEANSGQRGQEGYTIGLTASIPLYDAGQRRADVESADAGYDAAQANLQAVRLQIQKETSEAWCEVQSSSDELLSAQAGLSAAQQGFEFADLRYNAGKSTTAERLDALEALSKAQATLAQAKADEIDRQTALNLALGD